jgi:hypothetical protein
MSLKSAATVLSLRHPYLDPVPGEHANRCVIQLREGNTRDTPGMKSYPRAALSFCWKYFPNLVEEKSIIDLGLKLFELCNSNKLQ